MSMNQQLQPKQPDRTPMNMSANRSQGTNAISFDRMQMDKSSLRSNTISSQNQQGSGNQTDRISLPGNTGNSTDRGQEYITNPNGGVQQPIHIHIHLPKEEASTQKPIIQEAIQQAIQQALVQPEPNKSLRAPPNQNQSFRVQPDQNQSLRAQPDQNQTLKVPTSNTTSRFANNALNQSSRKVTKQLPQFPQSQTR